jgi:hypothetical protein
MELNKMANRKLPPITTSGPVANGSLVPLGTALNPFPATKVSQIPTGITDFADMEKARHIFDADEVTPMAVMQAHRL